MPDRTIGGLRLHWEEFGSEQASGRPVVLLHGLGSSGADWLLQTAVFGRQRRVVAPDLPGHGHSQGFRHWPGIGDFAEAVGGLLQEADAAPAHVVGLSLGGAVALNLAVASPDRVSSLVIVNGLARFRPSLEVLAGSALWLARVLSGRMDKVAEWVAEDLFPEPGQAGLREEAVSRLSGNRRGDYLRAMAAAARFNEWPRLGAISCPALIVAGELDRLLPVERQREMAEGIQGARLVIVPDSRHATPIDSAEAFNQIVLAFLEEVEQRGGAQRPVVSGQTAEKVPAADH